MPGNQTGVPNNVPNTSGGYTKIHRDTIYYYSPARLFFIYLGGLVVLVILCAISYLTLNNYHTLQNLEETGVTTQGQLVSHHIVAGAKSTAYYVTYSYTVTTSNGLPQSYQTQRQVDKETYERLAVGVQLPVRYLPAQPDVARLLEVKEDNFGLTIGLWLLLALTVAEVYLVGQIVTGHRVRAKHRLAQTIRN